jgi:hypothetical protein
MDLKLPSIRIPADSSKLTMDEYLEFILWFVKNTQIDWPHYFESKKHFLNLPRFTLK